MNEDVAYARNTESGCKLHLWVFQKAEIASWNCTSCFGECNLRFLKNQQVQINFKLK